MAVVKAKYPRRGEVHLVGLDPNRGREIQKTRPCVVVSPDELNAHLHTVVVAPLTSVNKPYPFRLECRFDKRAGSVVLDQIRTVDRERLIKRLGALSASEVANVLKLLREMFEA
jgi:mRNA interferase MazF